MTNLALAVKKKEEIAKTFIQPFSHLENLLKEKKTLYFKV